MERDNEVDTMDAATALEAVERQRRLLVAAYRRRTGMWVSGYRRGPAGRVSALLGAVYGVLYLGAAALEWGLDVRGPFVVAGVLMAGATVVLGNRFDEALRDELR